MHAKTRSPSSSIRRNEHGGVLDALGLLRADLHAVPAGNALLRDDRGLPGDDLDGLYRAFAHARVAAAALLGNGGDYAHALPPAPSGPVLPLHPLPRRVLRVQQVVRFLAERLFQVLLVDRLRPRGCCGTCGSAFPRPPCRSRRCARLATSSVVRRGWPPPPMHPPGHVMTSTKWYCSPALIRSMSVRALPSP